MTRFVTWGRRAEEPDPRIVDGEPPDPPPPPLQGKLWRFYRYQIIGIPLFLAVTAAAVVGFFGDTEASATASEGTLEAHVVAPDRFRFKMIGPMTVTVTNTGEGPFETVTVRVEAAYLRNFSAVEFSPAETGIEKGWHVFELGAIPSGGSATISGEIQAEAFGVHTGRIEVEAGTEAIALIVETWTFP